MADKDKLCVIWSSADKEVALGTAFMYTLNSKLRGWWGTVKLIVWGPSSRLLLKDKELQDHIAKMMDAGVEIQACKSCADIYGISDDLSALGIDVQHVGASLTEMLKSDDWAVLTY
ncbi:MAG: DsrE family protein [Deltaproteobacteria bacterium]|uniref:DsrE family protein n=1 Tax=Candidatus Zymogenus saltonus TaxID=2844893 RepID=A0A9D8KD81_9DELT|nr:DsrE family protein [Candidatus Zymogenus saltonus]